MASDVKDKRSQLFTLRVWTEETVEGRTEWRGKVQRAVSGETLYFRDWASMLAFVQGVREDNAREEQLKGAGESQVEQSTEAPDEQSH